jgi:hypothetical protein
MPDASIIEVSGRTAGIVARDSQNINFNFYSAVPRFNPIEGQRFSGGSRACGAHACETREHPAAPRNEIFSGQVGTKDRHLGKRECLADFAEGDAFRGLMQRDLEAFKSVFAKTYATANDRNAHT